MAESRFLRQNPAGVLEAPPRSKLKFATHPRKLKRLCGCTITAQSRGLVAKADVLLSIGADAFALYSLS